MIKTKSLDQRGVFHWHAIIVMIAFAGIGYVAVSRISAASASASSDKLTNSVSACVTILESQYSQKGLEATRKQSLKYVTARQTKASTLANAYASDNGKVSMLHKLYETDKNAKLRKALDSLSNSRRDTAKKQLADHRENLRNRIGVLGNGPGQSVQGRLAVYEGQMKSANTKAQLHSSNCQMMTELRVFGFWPDYIKLVYESGLSDVYLAQHEDNFDKAKGSAEAQTVRASLDSAKAAQSKLMTDVLSLTPANLGNSADFKSFFQPYNAQLKQLDKTNSNLKKQLKGLEKQAKKANKNTSSKNKSSSKPKSKAKISLSSPKLPPNFDRGNKNKYGYYKLPRSPNNELYYFYGYGSNTGDGGATRPNQRYGTGGLIRVFYSVAHNFHREYPEAKLVAGDLNAVAGHVSHKTGVDIDIYVKDRLGADMRSPYRTQKSVERTVALGKMLMATKKLELIYYNDSEVISKVNAYAATNNITARMKPSNDSHDYHLHVRLSEKGGSADLCAVVGTAASDCFKSADDEQPSDGNGTSPD